MMHRFFAATGRFAVRFRWAVVAAWVAAAILAGLLLPSLASVIKENNTDLLPASSPSLSAARLATPFQDPNQTPVLVVIARGSGTVTTADVAAIGAAGRKAGERRRRAAGQGPRRQRRPSGGAAGGPGQPQPRRPGDHSAPGRPACATPSRPARCPGTCKPTWPARWPPRPTPARPARERPTWARTCPSCSSWSCCSWCSARCLHRC